MSAVDFATVHLGLGEKTKALEWVERGLDEHATEMMLIKTDPRFDLVRSNLGFNVCFRSCTSRSDRPDKQPCASMRS